MHRLERAWLGALYAVPLCYPWTVAGAHLAVGLSAAGALAWGVAARRVPLSRTPADGGWLAFAVAALLAALCADERAAGFGPLEKLALIPLVHVAAHAFGNHRRALWAFRCAVLATSLVALIAAVEFLVTPQDPEARLRGTTHYMTFSGLLLLALPLAATTALRLRTRWRWVYTVCTFLLVGALGLTFTRSAWLGAIAAAVAVLVRVQRKALWLVPVAALVLFAAMPQAYRDRALSSFDLQHVSNQDRQRMWRAGIEIWRDFPWTGVGLGDLKPVYGDYAPPAAGRIHGHLHSNWIQVAASMGSLGLVAFVWLCVGMARLVWRPGTRSIDAELNGLVLGMWGAFWGFQTMGLFEWNYGDAEVTIALFFLLGACWGVERASTQEKARGEPAG